MLKVPFSNAWPRVRASFRRAPRSSTTKPTQAAGTVGPPAAQPTATSHNPQLAALKLPAVRKMNSPQAVDAPLREQVVRQAGGAGPKDRLAKFRTMTLEVANKETLTASSYLYLGAYGAVSLAVDKAGKPCAVKVMRTELKITGKTNVTAAEDIAREVAFTQKYVSGKVYAAADADNEVYLIMPLQAGSAHELVTSKADELPVHRAIVRSIGTQVAGSLADIHSHGDVVLDLKPDNIMIGHRGKVSISDFGAAEKVEDLQKKIERGHWTNQGSQAFASPEVQDFFSPGKSNTPLSHPTAPDVWSLGMSLLDMTSTITKAPFVDCATWDIPVVSMDLVAWRDKLVGENGQFDLRKLGTEQAQERHGFSAYFERVAERDPDLCRLLLSSVFTSAEERIDAATLCAKLRALQPKGSTNDKIANRSMVNFGADNKVQAATIDALRARKTKKPLSLRILEFMGVSIMTKD